MYRFGWCLVFCRSVLLQLYGNSTEWCILLLNFQNTVFSRSAAIRRTRSIRGGRSYGSRFVWKRGSDSPGETNTFLVYLRACTWRAGTIGMATDRLMILFLVTLVLRVAPGFRAGIAILNWITRKMVVWQEVATATSANLSVEIS